MAVLRASRLWAATAWPEVFGVGEEPRPGVEPLAAGDVFVCPEGKKAIIRHISSVMDGPWNPNAPEVQYKIRTPSGGTYWFHRRRWQPYTGSTQDPETRFELLWYGMVVVEPGDVVNIRNAGAAFYTHTYGSGMLVDI